MPKQKGVVTILGTLNELTFYQSQDGSLVRTKGTLNRDRISGDARFLRTRENNAEFTNAAAAGKLLRDTLRAILTNAADNRIIARLFTIMMSIKSLDTIDVRGQRTVANGIADPNGKALLDEFNFNIKAPLNSVLFSAFDVDPPTGKIVINNFVPLNDVLYPEGATHVSLQSAFAKVDFAAESGSMEVSDMVNLPIDSTSTKVVLTPANVPNGNGTSFYLLKITFYQMVNGVEYPLLNGASNSCAIVSVI